MLLMSHTTLFPCQTDIFSNHGHDIDHFEYGPGGDGFNADGFCCDGFEGFDFDTGCLDSDGPDWNDQILMDSMVITFVVLVLIVVFNGYGLYTGQGLVMILAASVLV